MTLMKGRCTNTPHTDTQIPGHTSKQHQESTATHTHHTPGTQVYPGPRAYGTTVLIPSQLVMPLIVSPSHAHRCHTHAPRSLPHTAHALTLGSPIMDIHRSSRGLHSPTSRDRNRHGGLRYMCIPPPPPLREAVVPHVGPGHPISKVEMTWGEMVLGPWCGCMGSPWVTPVVGGEVEPQPPGSSCRDKAPSRCQVQPAPSCPPGPRSCSNAQLCIVCRRGVGAQVCGGAGVCV